MSTPTDKDRALPHDGNTGIPREERQLVNERIDTILIDAALKPSQAAMDETPEIKQTDWNELKLALNNAVWMHGPGTVTLTQAEEATCLAISHLVKSAESNERKN